MEDQTAFTPKPPPETKAVTQTETTTTSTVVGKPRPNESYLFYVSMRAWIAIIVVGTVCYMSITEKAVVEPLYTLAGLIIGFFFGQAKPKHPPQ